ncbi:MAG: peptidylprolyl isomerase, partial [Bradymonadia bacterium]
SLKDGAFDRNFAPEFRKACGMIGDTGLSEVFPSPFGWHIVRISDRAKAKNESFEQAKKLISKGVLNEIRKREVEQLTQRLAATYPPLSDRPGILGLIKVEPLIRLEEKRRLPKLDE